MKRKVILIDIAEFQSNLPIAVPSIIDFTDIESVVFVVKTNAEYGGIEYLGAYLASEIFVDYTQIPLAQTIKINAYGVVPLEDSMKNNLQSGYQYTDDVPDEHKRIYAATPTTITFA
ncbi:hypothetical protein MPK66_gp257 [Erwinia phage pEa_SNUABM_2]|uniref:Uncharacterized protein n=1 Tax=Erwinia phage pEa_SNUABM_2 TaxID=2869547 RepID=A0AAE8C387_9CAUD|nr:hypothetical protein MPK66_gp257 [Erwinia phage pEa_SNUABM_2]QZE59501.1 hypothetical protein pEaSNUABM2_00257 [Erwinia phage pEa_SNUABM_2]QZE59837.1 hypothetical protein pEaSNUABM39_00257 [Erwinia phage pEa_SNUABM_39]